jgi:hypothetical protein
MDHDRTARRPDHRQVPGHLDRRLPRGRPGTGVIVTGCDASSLDQMWFLNSMFTEAANGTTMVMFRTDNGACLNQTTDFHVDVAVCDGGESQEWVLPPVKPRRHTCSPAGRATINSPPGRHPSRQEGMVPGESRLRHRDLAAHQGAGHPGRRPSGCVPPRPGPPSWPGVSDLSSTALITIEGRRPVMPTPGNSATPAFLQVLCEDEVSRHEIPERPWLPKYAKFATAPSRCRRRHQDRCRKRAGSPASRRSLRHSGNAALRGLRPSSAGRWVAAS